MLAGDRVEAVAGSRSWRRTARNDGELHRAREALRIFPTRQYVPLIAAHDPEKSGSGESGGHGLGSLKRVGRAVFLELGIIDNRPWNPSGGEVQHFQAIRAAGGWSAGLMGRNLAGQESDFVELQGLLR